jgi:cytochrome oxidase Cu insertion factor (SCO1/SenC/PrrC family)
VSTQQPPVAESTGTAPRSGPSRRLRLLFWVVAGIAGVGIGVVIALVRAPHQAAVPAGPPAPAQAIVSWKPGELAAPDFRLADENGKPVSLAAFRGRPVILTFMDPVCTDFCPLEAKVVNRVLGQLPEAKRPAVVAVSVNRWADSRRILVGDQGKWKLTPDWHWAVGAPPALRKVWADYKIAVQDTPTTKNGTTTHEISHTEAAFLVDAHGDQRAVFLWPFRAADVTRTLRQISG